MTVQSRLQNALGLARSALLEARAANGVWSGELSSSALSTATAVCALAVFQREGPAHSGALEAKLSRGLEWLAANVNADGGWGDTVCSPSNISTTTLCWGAFGIVPGAADKYGTAVAGAERWLRGQAGDIAPEHLARAITQCYGLDRTFSVPILTLCALAGRLGPAREAWSAIHQLPFELSLFPPEWFAALRLPVVSYALPALIAMGVARHRHRPTRNPLLRLARKLAEPRALSVLARIQPSNGGFLEATPLTSFVVMSLAGSGYAQHAATRKGLEFLVASARADGSWPIDTNLSTWLTTLAVNALAQAPDYSLPKEESALIRDWLLEQQHRELHPYTNASPGGWAWTDLPGGVPDADDTAGALLALKDLGAADERTRAAALAGAGWLLGLQNSDGGIPTFCRGWGKLPFDRSSPDLTAHAMRAWRAWLSEVPGTERARLSRALARASRFLQRSQQPEGRFAGGWQPLWFGNQHSPDLSNWTYGTSRVLLALSCPPVPRSPDRPEPDLESQAEAAAVCLAKTQLADGGWGGGYPDGPSSVEETALASEALAAFLEARSPDSSAPHVREIQMALEKGVRWLSERLEPGRELKPSPIGLYFAKLWYFEKLYPLIFTVAALGRAARLWFRGFSSPRPSPQGEGESSSVGRRN